MATAWDRHTAKSLASLQDELVRDQVSNVVAPFSPLWRKRFVDLNRKTSSVKSVADVAALPALGEREVSPSGDPVGMSSLVLQGGETGFTLHASGPEVRRALRLRITNRDAYRRLIDGDTRSTSYVFSGLGFRYPLASTRRDLDVITRAGARLWAVLGLTRNDVLVSAVPPGATTEHVGLTYAALGAGAPALFPGDDPTALAAAIRLAPPTVLAVPTATAAQVLSGLSDLGSVRTLLLVGAPTDAERLAASHALFRAGGPSDALLLAVHAPAGARLLWGECANSGGRTGLHTYPDLDLVQVIDPDTSENTTGAGELVLTQLGLRGSALLRWRTGDVVIAVTTSACPSCGRVVPRVEGLSRGALVARLDAARTLDLRSIAGVLSGRPDIEDWRLVVGRRGRDGAMSAVVHYTATQPEDPAIVIGVATDIRAVTGTLPTQLVASSRADLARLTGAKVSGRILLN